MSSTADTVGWESRSEWRFMLWSGVILTTLFVLSIAFGGGRIESLLVLPALAALLLAVGNMTVALSMLVVVLFIVFPISIFTSAPWFAVIVALAFLVNHRDIAWKDLSTPLTIPLVIFALSVVPSLFNAGDPWMCIVRMFNVFGFLTAMYATIMSVRDNRTIRHLVRLYIIMALLNGLTVIYWSMITGKRQYGFAGIMYVDYAGIAVCLLVIIALFTAGRTRILALVGGFVMGIALILTQTRNAWIATAITLGVVGIYLFRHPSVIGIPRRNLVRYAVVGIVLLVIVVGGALAVNPAVEQRAENLAEMDPEEVGETVVVQNSLITRLMIWHTAANAFAAHPWIGVGIYGFAQTSRQYSILPPLFYDRYVRNMSAHTAFFSILVEGGVVGMAGFLVFLGSVIRVTLRSVREARGKRAQGYALVGLTAMVYITVSMFLTDAWLWGQGGVLWGLVVGLIIATMRVNRREAGGVEQMSLQGSQG